MLRFAAVLALACVATPSLAKDSLGVFSSWAAFRDASPARCYAIAQPQGKSSDAFASVSTWPKAKIRNQVHFRLSRPVASGKATLRIGSSRFELTARGRDAWAKDKQADAAIVSAMRTSISMRVSAAGFTDRYALAGAATAMDAAVVGCSARK